MEVDVCEFYLIQCYREIRESKKGPATSWATSAAQIEVLQLCPPFRERLGYHGKQSGEMRSSVVKGAETVK